MNSEWQTVLLGDLCDLAKGSSPTQKTLPGEYPLVVTGADPLTSSEYQFEGEAVCVPMVSSTGHGHASLKRVHYASGRFAVANIITACAVKDPGLCNTRFLYLYLQHFKDELIVPLMKGTANVSLSQRALATVPVALPQLAEQRRIVDLIRVLDDAIEAAETQSSSASSLARAARSASFNRLSVSSPDTTAGQFFEVTLGRQKSARQLHGNNELPYLRAANILPEALRLTDVQTMHFDAREQEKYSLQVGDVLVVEGGSVGQTSVWNGEIDGPVCFDKHVLRLRGIPGQSLSQYAKQWASWSYESGQFLSEARGVTIKALGFQRAKGMKVPQATIEEQVATVEFLDSIDETVANTAALVLHLAKSRAELLTALFSGAHVIPASYDEVLPAS